MQTLIWFWRSHEFQASARIFPLHHLLPRNTQSFSEKMMSASLKKNFSLLPSSLRYFDCAWCHGAYCILWGSACRPGESCGRKLKQGHRAGRLKWPHISQRVLTVAECLSGCAQSVWLWVTSHSHRVTAHTTCTQDGYLTIGSISKLLKRHFA